jgi:hypothetical protein
VTFCPPYVPKPYAIHLISVTLRLSLSPTDMNMAQPQRTGGLVTIGRSNQLEADPRIQRRKEAVGQIARTGNPIIHISNPSRVSINATLPATSNSSNPHMLNAHARAILSRVSKHPQILQNVRQFMFYTDTQLICNLVD